MGDQEPAANPYESPKTADELPVEPLPSRRPGALAWVLVAIVAVPAFAISFFCTCLGVLVVGQPGDAGIPLGFGLVGGLAGIALTFYFGKLIIKKQRLRAEAMDVVAAQQGDRS